MEIKSISTKQNTAEFLATFSPEEISTAETNALTHIGQHKTIKGFRQGKAPISLLKQTVKPEEIKEEAIISLANKAARQIMEEQKFDLIGQPMVNKSDTKKPSWEITLHFPLYPKFELGDYQKSIKAIKVPKPSKKPEPNQKTKLDLILETLLKQINLEVPQSLIDSEVANSFSRLLDQAQTLNLSLEKYLSAINKTIDSVRSEYQTKAAENLKLEFILTAIASDQKITVTPQELDSFQKVSQSKPEQLSYLKSIIIRRKTIDFLQNL